MAHIPLYVRRGLYYQSLGRLWHVFQEFMQALFIAPRTYPIAYDKWVREQVEDSLGLPALYPHLTHLFEVGRLESEELVRKAQKLEELLEAHTGGVSSARRDWRVSRQLSQSGGRLFHTKRFAA
ncbi:MAG: hypothetical protein AB1645_02920 [Bacillota bacterium]